MKFRVTIKAKDGSEERQVVDAASRFEVYRQIQNRGGTVLDIAEGASGLHLPAWLDVSIGSPVKRAVVIRFAKNIAAMLAAGLSLSRALSITEPQATNKRLRAVVIGGGETIKGGGSLHEALAKYPRVFSGLFVAMAKAGEESGTLGESLGIVALQMERTEELTKKVKGAMIYPSIVIIAIIIVAVLMLMFVVPTLTATFTALGVKVPLTTRIIVALSEFMVGNAVLVVVLLLAFAGGAVALIRSAPGKDAITALSLHLPVIGELVRETYSARTARILASLLSSGVPVLEALAITRET